MKKQEAIKIQANKEYMTFNGLIVKLQELEEGFFVAFSSCFADPIFFDDNGEHYKGEAIVIDDNVEIDYFLQSNSELRIVKMVDKVAKQEKKDFYKSQIVKFEKLAGEV